MLRVGLTGGIASGKSHVRRRFEAAGFATLDLDHVTHELLAAGGAGQRAVVDAFGPALLAADGSVDRRALGALVFRDAEARARLNALVHPLIRAESERRAAALEAAGTQVLVTEAALLVETGAFLSRFDRLVVVHCSEAMQIGRLVHRDGIAPEAAEARLRAQMPIGRKRLFAHVAVDSSGAPAETDARADAAVQALLALARSPAPRVAVGESAALGCLLHGPQVGPRGLTPRRLVALIAAYGGLDLQACAAALDPPHHGPWYEAAQAGAGQPGPEALAGPIVLWALARRGADELFMAGAAAAVARLTHVEAAWVARAVVAAGLVFDVAVRGRIGAELHERVGHWARLSAGFGGALDAGWGIEATLRAALASRGDPNAASNRASVLGGDAGLAGALVGLVARPPGVAIDEALARELRSVIGAVHGHA
jgi:dephospho-CoA kinase